MSFSWNKTWNDEFHGFRVVPVGRAHWVVLWTQWLGEARLNLTHQESFAILDTLCWLVRQIGRHYNRLWFITSKSKDLQVRLQLVVGLVSKLSGSTPSYKPLHLSLVPNPWSMFDRLFCPTYATHNHGLYLPAGSYYSESTGPMVMAVTWLNMSLV